MIELLIGIAVGSLLIMAATGALMVALRSSLQNKALRTASSLNQELSDKATVFTENRWRNIYDLDKSPAKWFLTASGSGFATTSGSEFLNIEGISYERYFTVANVQRDANGNIVDSGGTNDPSTQLITANVSWLQGGNISIIARSKYFTRARNLGWRSVPQSPYPYESPVFDSDVSGGTALNTIMWQGGGGTVKFQIASSDSSSGPWNYFGPNSNPVAYYQPAGPSVQEKITTEHNNKRYFRYKIFILSGSPTVTEVIINYSP